MSNDPFNPDDLTHEERNAKALARNDLEMLADLVRLRQELGLTQEDVAKVIGRDKSAVSRFERLDSDPRLSTVRRYARAVGALIEHRVTEFAGSRTAEPRWDVTIAMPQLANVILSIRPSAESESDFISRWEGISTVHEDEASFPWMPDVVSRGRV
ncbi:hypothetical protein A5633_08390 [Mycolicibacterium elephantis]|uniref:helix-turn-helix domain-containing protein n=1 Tax=Mycolicibacterium elephantis TaxID=81858 RepID=UPI0007E936C3|nr:helix-turn-helix transcriptional regulator [Mycolicibacterium elephantis]OBA88778.1 hypothetical protein A5633_08390 [Mycolicibacterium elephantis]